MISYLIVYLVPHIPSNNHIKILNLYSESNQWDSKCWCGMFRWQIAGVFDYCFNNIFPALSQCTYFIFQQSVSVFDPMEVNCDSCAVFMFNFCITSSSLRKMCFRTWHCFESFAWSSEWHLQTVPKKRQMLNVLSKEPLSNKSRS